ncbi:MAG TPA: sigma-70 family RNA polymerase sigma factor [Allosphingosinicella sp.]|jgi:RNA polymerase sigma-70 factor (ECF subfamily)|nr:sigma-70 family RNA polymerase sigma factor [Allosphingosinicella sp.]
MMAAPLTAFAFPSPVRRLFLSGGGWCMIAGMEQTGGVPGRPEDSQLARLMTAVSAGDGAALADLYERTSAKLYGICLRILGSEAEAEEALQEAFVTIWRRASSFDIAKASPITWLSVLTRNKAIDRLRTRRFATDTIEAANDVADDSASAVELIEAAQDRERLAHCLGELDEQPRAAIRAAFFDGLTYQELAERDEVPIGTMKSWIRRGLIRLKTCLER